MTIAIHPRIEDRPRRRGSFPRLPLYSAFALVAFAFGTILFSQATGIGSMITDPGQPLDMIDLTISQADGDHVRVSDANSGKVLAEYGPADGGFVRGSMRALARMRMTADVDANEPYRVIKWSSGAVSLSDTRTGQRIYLNAFGPDQVAAFEKFLGSNGG
jgi:putative photosynthetic complex assembly protein